jgi:hypothetical protein
VALEDRLPLGDTVGGVLAWSLLGPSAFTTPSGPGPITGVPALAARRDGLFDFGANRVQPLEAAQLALAEAARVAKPAPGQGSHDVPAGNEIATGTSEAGAQRDQSDELLRDFLQPSETAAAHRLARGRDADIAEALPPASAPAAEPAVGSAPERGTASPASASFDAGPGAQAATSADRAGRGALPLILPPSGPAETPQAVSPAALPNRQAVPESYGRLPISFEANYGQTDAKVDFIARGGGCTMFLTPTEAVMTLSKPAANSSPQHLSPAEGAALGSLLASSIV